jgi:hypothetical protein
MNQALCSARLRSAGKADTMRPLFPGRRSAVPRLSSAPLNAGAMRRFL